MSRIVPCTRDHIPAIVEFFSGSPTGANPAGYAAACARFERVYFDNPWYTSELPSLVCEGADGRIEGFLGVIHRPMTLHGRPIRAAVSSDFRVVRGEEAKPRNPVAALRLMKAFFRGPQDLSLADRANAQGKRIWEACGGLTVPLYSLDWFRPIRPARAVMELAWSRNRRRPARVIQLMGDAADLVAVRLGKRFMPQRTTCSTGEFDAEFAVDALARASKFDLKPVYDVASLQWLLEMSGSRGGRLSCGVVEDGGQRKIGWFVYLRRKERPRVGLVLQMGAPGGDLSAVLRAAIEHATSQGVALLRGVADVSDLQAYDRTLCTLHAGRRWMLVHAPQEALVAPFLHGKALVSGLEGEWWLPDFEPEDDAGERPPKGSAPGQHVPTHADPP